MYAHVRYGRDMSAADFGGGSHRTWDGLPVSREPPYGSAAIVYRHVRGRPEFLLLHRRHSGPDFAGDWAWGPPSGARCPAESVDRCAERELLEETGLHLLVSRVETGSVDWCTFLAEAPASSEIQLSAEHDRYVWLPIDQAVALVAPETVKAQLLAVAHCLQAGR